MSEGEKRKHNAGGGDAICGTKKKVRDDVTDDEVEEFYAILRRMNAAVQYFKSGNNRDNGTASQPGWRASLEEEIMRQVDSVKENAKRCETLDLNLSPDPE